jgi:hypothetical protein
MKTISEKGPSKPAVKRPSKRIKYKNEELKTDMPLSEKDEVKKAEERMQKNIRK